MSQRIYQKIVPATDMADFLLDFDNKGINVNILTCQPYSFEKRDDGSYQVKKYLWVFIPTQLQQVQGPIPSPLIIPRSN